MKNTFQKALKNQDIKAIRESPKSDLHNHCLMGGKLRYMEKFYGKKINPFRSSTKGIYSINDWIVKTYRPVFDKTGAFGEAIAAAFLQAKSDGVTVLEMSMDVTIPGLLNIPAEKVILALQYYHKAVAPEIKFLPEIGLARNLPARLLLASVEPYIDSRYFKSIDLYDDESAQPLQNFGKMYRYAKNMGLKLKAHAGEFSDATYVKQSVEILDLDVVQHGIAAADSDEVMKWLAKHNIQLNICPASNIVLKRTKSYKTHPIRILYDNGIKVTVNTDDVILFGKGNSEQYLQLYKCGLFKAEELDKIRENGLLP